MDSLIPSNIRNLLLNHHLEVASDGPWEDLVCTLCRRLSMNAYQTFCGCTFCRRCIYNRLKGIDEICPGGKADCQMEGLVFDRNVKRNVNFILRISRLKVVCPHESCSVVTEVSQMMAHMKVCPERPIVCPFAVLGCTSDGRVSGRRMKIHIQEEAVAHCQMMMDRFGEIHKYMNDDPKEKIERAEKQKNDHIHERREMNEDHIQLAGWDSGLQEEIPRLKEEIPRLKEEVQAMKDEAARYKEDTNQKLETIEAQTTKAVATTVTHVQEERMRFDQLTEIVDELNIGTNKVVSIFRLSFKVDKFTSRMNEEDLVYSPHFYTHMNGYKLRLEVYPRGYYEGRGSHMSVLISICKGEYDDALSWPCKYLISMAVVNQRTNVTFETRTISYSSIFKDGFLKPTKGDNPGCGPSSFISHKDLLSIEGILVDESVLLHIAFTPPPL